MMSVSEGGGEDTGRLREFYCMNQFQMRTRGKGSKNPKILWTSLMEDPEEDGMGPLATESASDISVRGHQFGGKGNGGNPLRSGTSPPPR